LAALVKTSDEWITTRTGIRSRHRVDEREATSDLAARAARFALADAGMQPDQLDFILVATATPDTLVPAASCLVQDLLGASAAAAMDVNAGCSGFLYGLHTADSLIRSGAANNVLLIGAETLTRVTDYSDRRTCVLFGDGAGACIVAPTGSLRVIRSLVGADGSQQDLIRIPAGGSRVPASVETVEKRQHYLQLDGRRVFRQAVRRMVEAALETLEAVGLSTEQISWVIPHQANERIITAVAEQLGIPVPKVVLDLADTGNTSAASVPIALARAREATAFRRGEYVMLLAFGAGLTWSAQLLRVESGDAG
jgi:3-oxoacyl-[acyl-carrier-protein] synthase-3